MKKILYIAYFASTLLCTPVFGVSPEAALEDAIITSNYEQAENAILVRDADVNTHTSQNCSPLDLAQFIGNGDIIALLKQNGALTSQEASQTAAMEPNGDNPARTVQQISPKQRHNLSQTDLRTAVLNDDVEQAILCISGDASIKGSRGQELLKLAADTQKFQIMEWLIGQGVTLATGKAGQLPEEITASASPQQPTSSSSSSTRSPAKPSSADAPVHFAQDIAQKDTDTCEDRDPVSPSDYDKALKRTLRTLLSILKTGHKEKTVAKIRIIVQQKPRQAQDILRKAIAAQHDSLIMLLMEGGTSLAEHELTRKHKSAPSHKRKAASSSHVDKSKRAPKKMRSASSASAWKNSWLEKAVLKAQKAKNRASAQKVLKWTPLDWAYYNQDKAQIKKLKNVNVKTSISQAEVTALLSKYGYTNTVDFEKYYIEFMDWSSKFNDDIPLEFLSERFAHYFAQRAAGSEGPSEKRHEVEQDWEKQQSFEAIVDTFLLAHHINKEREEAEQQ